MQAEISVKSIISFVMELYILVTQIHILIIIITKIQYHFAFIEYVCNKIKADNNFDLIVEIKNYFSNCFKSEARLHVSEKIYSALPLLEQPLSVLFHFIYRL